MVMRAGALAVATRRVWRRLRPARRDLVVVAVAAVVLVLVTADVVAGGLLTYADDAIRHALPSSDDAPGWTRVVGLAGNVGVGGAAVLVVSIVTMHARLTWWPGVLAAGVLATTSILVLGVKYLVGRDGHSQDAAPDGYPGFYPSGHTATAAVAVGIIVFLLSSGRSTVSTARRLGLSAAAAAGLVVGASTVLGGFHWMSDAVGSLAIAAGVLVAGFGMAESYLAGPRRRTASDRS